MVANAAGSAFSLLSSEESTSSSPPRRVPVFFRVWDKSSKGTGAGMETAGIVSSLLLGPRRQKRSVFVAKKIDAEEIASLGAIYKPSLPQRFLGISEILQL
jgi:hypothetical protein